MSKKYDGVLFDFDGVLFNSGIDNFQWANKVREREAKKLGLNNIEGHQLDLLFTTPNIREFKRKIDLYGLNYNEYKRIEREVSKERVRLVKSDYLRLFDDVQPTIKSLEVSSAVVSNAYYDSTAKIIKHYKLNNSLNDWKAPALDDLLRYLRLMKPNPVMLNDASHKISSKNPIMVGDTKSDILAAKNAGIDSVLIDRSSEKPSFGEDYRIQSLNELQHIINR